MDTFRLVLYGEARDPRGITSVPGFTSEVECTIAAGEIMNRRGI